eukprot:GSA25T00013687001.1
MALQTGARRIIAGGSPGRGESEGLPGAVNSSAAQTPFSEGSEDGDVALGRYDPLVPVAVSARIQRRVPRDPMELRKTERS